MTVTFQDTEKGLFEDFQDNFVAACTIELSVQTSNILFSLPYYTRFLLVVVFKGQSITVCEGVFVLKACSMQHETVENIFSNNYIEEGL
jgi:hypothetical protein